MKKEEYKELKKLVKKWETRSHFLRIFTVKTTIITSIILIIILNYIIDNG